MNKFSQFLDIMFLLEDLFRDIIYGDLDFLDFLVDINHHAADVCEVDVGFGHLEGGAIGLVLRAASTQDNNRVSGLV
jgi:hypothetical protein